MTAAIRYLRKQEELNLLVLQSCGIDALAFHVFSKSRATIVQIHSEYKALSSVDKIALWFLAPRVVGVRAVQDDVPSWVRNRASRYWSVPISVDPIYLQPLNAHKANGRSVVLSAGRLALEREPLLALDVLAKLPAEITLQFAGTGPLRKALQEQVKVRGLQERVRFLGNLTSEELCKAFEESDVVLSTAPHESYGRTLLEASLRGVPVVSRATYGARRFVDRGLPLFVVRDSAARNLAEKILEARSVGPSGTFRSAARNAAEKIAHQIQERQIDDLILEVLG
jgi:glycosyltransferase involved in cell wall biosynthesis